MRNQILILAIWLLAMLLLPHPVMSQQSIQTFVDRYVDKRDSFESLTYEVDFEQKNYSSDDTSRISAAVEVVRNPMDSIYGGFLFIESSDNVYAYDGSFAYMGQKETSTITLIDIAKFPDTNIKQDWTNPFREESFLTRNQGARQAVQNPEIMTTMTDTVIGALPCKAILMKVPDQEGFTGMSVFVAIDTVDLMLRKRVTFNTFQENEQYQSWTFKGIAYGDRENLDRLTESFISTFEHQREYEKSEPEAAVKQMIDYSTLEGKLMNSNTVIAIKNIDAEVFILDFWYSSCYPCIKSIPEVNKIYDRFKDKGVAVYGVNIIDDEIRSKSRLEKYVRNNPMGYNTIMADRTLYEAWVSEGYPSLLMLDSDYKLIKMHSGFTEDMADEIGLIIEAHLKD